MPRSIEKALRKARSVGNAAKRLTKRQAGGIVFRVRRGGVEVLLVTARRSRKRWVLPKGSIERGELPVDAALREVREEAGVRGKVVAPAGIARYVRATHVARVEYFLIAYRGEDADAGESRRVAWLSIDDAAAKISHTSARRVLLLAEAQLRLLGGAEARRGR